MLRVLTLSTLFPDAGRPTFGVFVERQTRGLAALPGVEVRVVAPVGLPPLVGRRHPRWAGLAALPLREVRNGLDVLRPRFATVPGLPAASPWSLALALRPVLRGLCREFPFDVIDAEFFFPDGPAASAGGGARGGPGSTPGGGADIHLWGVARSTRAMVRRAGRAADGLLAVSAALRDDMAALGIGGARVHYTGVDLDRFRPADRAAAKAALGIDGPLILSTGALISRKRHHLAIAALPLLPGVTLAIAGEGPERGRLAALAASLGVANRVRLLGRVAHDDLPAWGAAADVGVLVSSSEGLANAWVEALASGAPIVVADIGGARELLDRPEAGRIVAPEPDAIAAAVAALIADRPDPAAVRACAARFTWEANAAALRDHLTRVARAERPA